jgi:peptidoglycan/xylan/chitin deacetylase (PgdA/CDA1 family)
MYHRVLTPEERAHTASHPGIIVERDTFARQMAVLKKRFVVLSAEEFARRLEQGTPFESSSCLITFDDGWRDNHANALPVLRENVLPALIFLPVNFIGRRRPFWQEALTRLLLTAWREAAHSPDLRRTLQALLSPLGFHHVLDAPAGHVREVVMNHVSAAKHAASVEIQALVSALATKLGVDLEGIAETDGFLDWAQVADMAEQGISFGGHGAEHRLLTNMPLAEADQEIRAAREVVESRVSAPVLAFSYPNGSWAPPIAAAVRASGHRMAFTTLPGRVACTDDPFLLRRVNIHQDATDCPAMFLARIVGLF